jgi:hypothetical protein
MASLCSQMIILNVIYHARVQSHGACLPLLRRLHEGRHRYNAVDRTADQTAFRTKIVYAIRDWPFEEDQAKRNEVQQELLRDFEAQWEASWGFQTEQVSWVKSLLRVTDLDPLITHMHVNPALENSMAGSLRR